MSANIAYVPTFDEIQLAQDWYGGQASMLYAVGSTGALALGSVRPYGVDTDDEWADSLRLDLMRELDEVISARTVTAEDKAIALAFRESVRSTLIEE